MKLHALIPRDREEERNRKRNPITHTHITKTFNMKSLGEKSMFYELNQHNNKNIQKKINKKKHKISFEKRMRTKKIRCETLNIHTT